MLRVLGSILALALLAPPCVAEPGRFEDAASYSRRFNGVSLIVMKSGKVLYEEYPNGGGPLKSTKLHSGSKSFSGLIALAAAEDGLLALDEPASATITEWRDDPLRRRITVRDILTLTSGLDPGRLGKFLDFKDTVALPLTAAPKARFQYGPNQFQAFGELMRRKLIASGRSGDVLEYLRDRILRPVRIGVANWSMTEGGDPNLASGASMTARNWARLGTLILRQGELGGTRVLAQGLLPELRRGTLTNPGYGLTFWLNNFVPPQIREEVRLYTYGNYLGGIPGVPKDLIAAAGYGGQLLYVSRTEDLVVVRQSETSWRDFIGRGFKQDEFARRLFSAFRPGERRLSRFRR